MKPREMEKFTAHCEKYFEQKTETVLHPSGKGDLHIDILRFKPTEKYPFWKLVTMGASDYKMPKQKVSFGDRNEYMMFIHPAEDLRDKDTLSWYGNILTGIAVYPARTKTAVSYTHSIEWGEAEPGCDMEGAYIEMPQMIESTDILHCKLGPFKTVACLQVVTLTRAEINILLEIGPQRFSNYLYPDEDGALPHFLCEKKRTDRF